MHDGCVANGSGAECLDGGCVVKMSGVSLIRDVSSPASDGLYDYGVMKSGLAIRDDGQSGIV